MYLVIACIVTVGAGAAVGTVLTGLIEGDISVSVSQSILVERPTVTDTSGNAWAHRSFTSVSDDKTKFTASAEAYAKETFVINLPVSNLSKSNLNVKLSFLSIPSGVTVDVQGNGVISSANIVRVDANTWKFVVPGGASDGTPPPPSTNVNWDGIKIQIALASNVAPGFYELDGQISVTEY
jgi:hypothetical protein